MNVRENWRIALLVVFVLGSSVLLFGPLVAGNGLGLDYGLDLSGGTQVRAPLVGVTAESVEYPEGSSTTELRRALANDLDVSQNDLSLRPRQRAVELYTDDVANQAFIDALESNGFGVQEARVTDGVTEATREEVIATLDRKINQGGLTGGGASIAASGSDHFVVVEVPNANRSEVLNLIEDRGQVEIVARFPVDENGTERYREVSLVTNDDFTNVGSAQPAERGRPPRVSVSLEPGPAENYSAAMQRFGFTSPEGMENCDTATARVDPDNATGYCLLTMQDGEVVDAHQMGRDLAANMRDGDFTRNPTFVMTASNISEAQRLSINLNAGALPTELDIDAGTSYFLLPSLAQEFKLLSVIAGLVAWLAVSGVVFVRYGSPKVAVPMLATAAAEVYLLLGFAAAVGLALDLSHIAGFIAVIGTGVDDLIIIADEILQEGEVATGRVFQSRFKKAFWVIGAAAATTIIAMSPLTVLSLGDLTGFAIVTIAGVLLGVLVSRPAYGDVLRNLMVEEE